MGFSKKKAIEYLKELEEFGLVEKKRRGLGLPSILYVKSFLVQEKNSRGVENDTSRGTENGTLRGAETKLQE
ncbi:MAG: replication initiation protein, partial [Tyzzerella sp.]|nr:replication initiation protein [Tyzzerella sp.]